MNVYTTILSSTVLLAGYFLGIPVLFCLLAFNAIIWVEIAYKIVTPKKMETLEELIAVTKPIAADPMQAEFEKFLLRKYHEFTAVENQVINQGISSLEENSVAVAES